MDFFLAQLGSSSLCVSAVCVTVAFLERSRLARRLSRAEAKVARLSREAGALNDDLLQSMQGFVLTVNVAIQHGSYDPAARRRIDQAFQKAERAVIDGRERFERLHLRPLGKGPCERVVPQPDELSSH